MNNHHRVLSYNPENLLCATKNNYVNKCSQFWNNFDKPTNPTLVKGFKLSKKFLLKNIRETTTKSKTNKPLKIEKIKIVKPQLPPIRKVYSNTKNKPYYETWEVESDDEDGFLSLYGYQTEIL